MKKSMKNSIVTAVLTSALLLTSANAFAFSDVAEDHWASSYITKLTDSGYINGYEDGTFAPSNFITRAEFVTIINKVKGVSATSDKTFTDVQADKWYANEINKAVTAGFITGYDDGTVRPDAYITRAEVAVVCYKAWNLAPEGTLNFVDSNDIGTWAQQQVATLVAKNIISGYEDGTFKPGNNITRAEVAKIVACLIEMQDNAAQAQSTTAPSKTPANLSQTPVVIKNGSSSSGGSGGSGGGGGGSSSSSAPSKSQKAALEDIADGSIDKDTLSTVVKYSSNSATVKKDFEDLYSDALKDMLSKLDSEYDDYDLSDKTDAKKFANDVSSVVLAVNKASEQVKSLAKKGELNKSNLLDMYDDLVDIIDSKATKSNREDINEVMADFCENLYDKVADIIDDLNGKTLSDTDLMRIYNGKYDGKTYTAPTSTEKNAIKVVESLGDKDTEIKVSNLNTIIKYADSNNSDKELADTVKPQEELTSVYTDALNNLVKSGSYESTSDMDAQATTEFAMDITATVSAVNKAVEVVGDLAKDGKLNKDNIKAAKTDILNAVNDCVSKENKAAVENIVVNMSSELLVSMEDKLDEINGKDLTVDEIVKLYNDTKNGNK